MLKQDLDADEDKDGTARALRPRLEAQAEDMADINAEGGQAECRDADEGGRILLRLKNQVAAR